MNVIEEHSDSPPWKTEERKEYKERIAPGFQLSRVQSSPQLPTDVLTSTLFPVPILYHLGSYFLF